LKAGLHWDLRFSIPDSKNWASYAFRKDPSTIKQGEKFTCIRTPDHNEENALYTGEIQKGEYGAGILKKIDSGNCDVLNFKQTRMAVTFYGTKLKGSFHFINVGIFGGYKDFKKKMFMFFRAKIGD
jgi:bifunctional non-homologous end joining protein LigD